MAADSGTTSSTVRRWLIVAVVVGAAVFFATQGHKPKHYSDVPGQGQTIDRQQLPPLDTSTGGAPDVAPSTPQPRAHIPAHPAVVEPPIPPPPPVPATRVPAPETNTAITIVPGGANAQPSSGGAGNPPNPGLPLNPLP